MQNCKKFTDVYLFLPTTFLIGNVFLYKLGQDWYGDQVFFLVYNRSTPTLRPFHT